MSTTKTWDDRIYYSNAAAADDLNLIVETQTTDAAFYDPTDDEKKYNALREKYYTIQDELRNEQDKLWQEKIGHADSISNMNARNQALNEVVKGVFAQVRFSPEIYKKIVDTIDNYEGSYAVNFIIEDILKNLNDEAKDFIQKSTSKRRINIPEDRQVTIKEKRIQPPLTLNRTR